MTRTDLREAAKGNWGTADKELASAAKPVYPHNCDQCIFLGGYPGERDLYWCNNDGRPDFVLRYGSAQYDVYRWEVALGDPEFGWAHEAKRRAITLGLCDADGKRIEPVRSLEPDINSWVTDAVKKVRRQNEIEAARALGQHFERHFSFRSLIQTTPKGSPVMISIVYDTHDNKAVINTDATTEDDFAVAFADVYHDRIVGLDPSQSRRLLAALLRPYARLVECLRGGEVQVEAEAKTTLTATCTIPE